MFRKLWQWWLGRQRPGRRAAAGPESQVIVAVTPSRISATYPGGISEQVDLGLLEKIEIYTNDSGPWGADVWFVLSSSTGKCHFPQGATGEQAALDFMLALPRFNYAAFTRAMGSASNAVFLCWSQPRAR